MNNVVHCCDCMDLMKTKPDNYYDLAIVDPPYGIGMSKELKLKTVGDKKWKLRREKGYKAKEWDEKIPDANYFNELFRISKNQIIWGGNYFIEYLSNTSNIIL